jgi:hypothetical protein
LHVFADFGDRDERPAWHDRRSELRCQQPLVDAIDLERIGVEGHEAEVGFAAADDERLQADRRFRAGRIKCRSYFARTFVAFGRRKLFEARSIEGVVQMARVPSAASWGKRVRDRLGGGIVSGSLHDEGEGSKSSRKACNLFQMVIHRKV